MSTKCGWPTPSFGAETRRCRFAPRCRQLPEPMAAQPRAAAEQAARSRLNRAAAAAACGASRTSQRAGVGHAATADHHGRLNPRLYAFWSAHRSSACNHEASASAATQAAPSTAGSAPISSSADRAQRRRGAADTHSKPTSTGWTGSSVADATPIGTVSPFQLTARRRDVARGLVHRVGQRGPLPDPGPGQLVGQPRRAGGSHSRRGRRQAVAPQHLRRMPRSQGRRRGVRFARPGGQGSQHGDGVPRMGQRPCRGHHGADGHPADGDRGGACRIVEVLRGSHR